MIARLYDEDKLETKDHIPWTFISYYRQSQFQFDAERDGFANRMVGDNVSNVVLKNKVYGTYVRALPINLTYSVDVWSATQRQVLVVAEELAYRLFFNERVLTAPVDVENEEARFAVTNLDWVDNSDVENEEEYGKVYRHTFTFSIDAVIKLVRKTKTYQLDLSKISIEIYEGDDINNEVCKECDYEKLYVDGRD